MFDFLSGELTEALSAEINDFENVVITNVPRRKPSILKYGYDHAAVIARLVAKHTGAEYASLLISKAEKVQKRLQREERIKNASFAYKKKLPDLKGKTVIVVDDIVTTGASMGACAALIRGLGPKTIIGAAISIAYKDKQEKIATTDRFGVNKRS